MDAHDKLIQASMLGAIVEQVQEEQLNSVGNREAMRLAAIQLDAANICVQEALVQLDAISQSRGWMMWFALCITKTQLTTYSAQLMKAAKRGGNDLE